MANEELLRTVVGNIEAHPETFRMDDWACGTRYCIGGHAILAAGYGLVKFFNYKVCPPGGEYKTMSADEVHNLARDLLGLNEGEADQLFYDYHGANIEELKVEITAITGVTFP